jgi:hypothetical protein
MHNRKAIEQRKRVSSVAEGVGALAALGRALGKAVTALTCESGDLFVEGGSLVRVPKDRLIEIPKVLEEHRRCEKQRDEYLAYIRRAY